MGRRLRVLRDLRFVLDPPSVEQGWCRAGEVVEEIAVEQVERDAHEFRRILAGGRRGSTSPNEGRAPALALFLWNGHPRTAAFGADLALADLRRSP